MAYPNFFISKANPLQWVIETGAGTLSAGEIIDGNYFGPMPADNVYLIPDQTLVPEKVNCFVGNTYVQCWDCGDVIRTQFIMDYDETQCLPMVLIYDYAGNLVGSINWASLLVEEWVYLINLTLSGDYCANCIKFEIWSYEVPEPNNIYLSNNNGDFEFAGPVSFNAGGFTTAVNAVSLSTVQWHSTNHSMLITSSAAPDATSQFLAIDGTTITLTTGTVYSVKAWVYLDGTSRIVNQGPGAEIEVSVNTQAGEFPGGYAGFTDAFILYRFNYDVDTLAYDRWTQIETVFQVGSVVTGSISFKLNNSVPNASGLMYVDDITIDEAAGYTKEAESNTFSVNGEGESCPCTTYVEYGPITGEEHPQFQLNYSSTLTTSFYVRLPIMWKQFKIVDSNSVIDNDSENTKKMVKALFSKLYQCRTDWLPWWMVEKIPMMMKHDKVLFDSLPMIANTGDIAFDWQDSYTLAAKVKWEMFLRDYNYQNSNCGQV